MRGQIRVTKQNLNAVCKALINEAENCHYNSMCFGMMDIIREENVLTEIDNILVSIGKVFDISYCFPADWDVADLKGSSEIDSVLISYNHCKSLAKVIKEDLL